MCVCSGIISRNHCAVDSGSGVGAELRLAAQTDGVEGGAWRRVGTRPGTHPAGDPEAPAGTGGVHQRVSVVVTVLGIRRLRQGASPSSNEGGGGQRELRGEKCYGCYIHTPPTHRPQDHLRVGGWRSKALCSPSSWVPLPCGCSLVSPPKKRLALKFLSRGFYGFTSYI